MSQLEQQLSLILHDVLIKDIHIRITRCVPNLGAYAEFALRKQCYWVPTNAF